MWFAEGLALRRAAGSMFSMVIGCHRISRLISTSSALGRRMNVLRICKIVVLGAGNTHVIGILCFLGATV